MTYYKVVFDISQNCNFSIPDIEELIPFERDVYISMINEKIEKAKNANNVELANW